MIAGPNQRRSRVLVIGAGVSGCTAAIRLTHHGHDVTLAERAVFPREKICGCCLGAAGLRALDAIGLGETVRDLGTPTHTFVAYLQTSHRQALHEDGPRAGLPERSVCSSPIRLPIAPGVAVSRATLDSYLVQQAARSGVRVWQPCEAQVVTTSNDCVAVRYRSLGKARGQTTPLDNASSVENVSRDRNAAAKEDWQDSDEFDLVVLATGLTGVFSGGNVKGAKEVGDDRDAATTRRWQLPWIESPHGPLGIAAHLPNEDPLAAAWDLPRGEIQMVCGDEGYVGLVRLPGGEIDIAAALRSERQRRHGHGDEGSSDDARSDSTTGRLVRLLQSHPDWKTGMNELVHEWLAQRARLMTAPPLRRRRQPGLGRVVAIGDCAGYVEPMTGEGMTWGIESGIAVADLWDGRSLSDDFVSQWNHTLKSLQPKRRMLCGSVTRAMRSATLRFVTLSSLRPAPWLARPITRGLATGPSFQMTHSSDSIP